MTGGRTMWVKKWSRNYKGFIGVSRSVRNKVLFYPPLLHFWTFCFPLCGSPQACSPLHPRASSHRLTLYLAHSRGMTPGELLKARCPSDVCGRLCSAKASGSGAPASASPIPFVRVCLVILQHGADRGRFSGGQLPVRLLRL